jgi:hypothetical protein
MITEPNQSDRPKASQEAIFSEDSKVGLTAIHKTLCSSIPAERDGIELDTITIASGQPLGRTVGRAEAGTGGTTPIR